ncbi:TTN [Lepeophtheirus salmonis]|uniref:TTN n=1 Tax=Lepeophtheirus salmonis TaxID=72036 RepID=A0A7R8H0S0_LEPSM|nr:TTN [Lepeophtheirus salmonis]CAF2794701.1 TTN [Lepeophtheirus salmonis]
MNQIYFIIITLYTLLIPLIDSNDTKLPKIIEKLAITNRIEYSNGDKIKLRCPILGPSPFKITWRKDGKFLEDSSARHYSISGKHEQYLRIKRMNDDDDGEYECKGQSSGVKLLARKMSQGIVSIGETSELTCFLKDLGKNDVVRWLKRLKVNLPESSPFLRDVIRIPSPSSGQNERGVKKLSYKRLDPQSNPRYHLKNASYLENGHRIYTFSLQIEETIMADSGEYVCLVVEPLVDKKFKFNIGQLSVQDGSVPKSVASTLTMNRITIWAIFIPLAFILIGIGSESKPGVPPRQGISSTSSSNQLELGPMGKSISAIPEEHLQEKHIQCCQRAFYSS